nr:hypothetical protein [Tanacetum cinerariifolium]
MMIEDPYVEVALQAPPSPDYMPSPEEPEQAPPSLDYIPGPEHADDEIVAEDQPYAEDASPIAQSPEYVPESDFEMHLEDDDDEDPEEDPVDYPADGGDNGDDEEESLEDEEDDEMDVEADEEEEEHPAPADSEESSEDDEEDEDDEMDIEADDEEEEEEHPAPADSIVFAPTAADQAPSAEETEPFETDESAATPPPHPAYRTTARISIPAPVPTPAWTNSEVVRLLAISSPPASPLSHWSSLPPQIPFPPLPPILSPPLPVLSPAPPPSPIRSLGYRAAMIRLRDEAASTSHSPLLQLPSASRREDRPDVTLPPRKRLDIALGPRYEVGESSSAAVARPAGEREVGYGITDSWDEILETLQGAPAQVTTLQGQHGLAGDHTQSELPKEAGGNSNKSGVTYTDISSPFEELSDIGSPRADDHEYLMLPEMLEDPYVEVALQAPPSPDYMPGPKEPEQAPPSPDYVPCPEHTDDEIVAEDQPYAEDASPIAQSPDAPVYDIDGSSEVHENCDDNEIFNMFTQEKQYTELLKPIPESHQ